MNEQEFKAFLESYRKLDEDECGCYNPLPRQADQVWSLVGKFDLVDVSRHANEPTFEHWKKFTEIYWTHFMLLFKSS